MGWLGITSSEYHKSCGDDGTHTASTMLDSGKDWWHVVDEVHTLELDLGSSQTVTQVRFRGNNPVNGSPNDIDVYVSDDDTSYGTAVATGIDPSTYTGETWLEILTTSKSGR